MKTQVIQAAKYLLVLHMILFIPVSMFSQQVISFKNGIEFPARILSANGDTIRFELMSTPGVPCTAGLNQVKEIRNFAGTAFDKEYLQAKLNRGKRTMYSGLTLLGTGIILAVTGTNMVKDSHYATDEYYRGNKIAVTSIPFVISGVVLSAIGSSVTLSYA